MGDPADPRQTEVSLERIAAALEEIAKMLQIIAVRQQATITWSGGPKRWP